MGGESIRKLMTGWARRQLLSAHSPTTHIVQVSGTMSTWSSKQLEVVFQDDLSHFVDADGNTPCSQGFLEPLL